MAASARESAAIHSKQQVIDWARDLIWLWMSQPRRCLSGRSNRSGEARPRITHFVTAGLCLHRSSVFTVSAVQRTPTPSHPSLQRPKLFKTRQRCANISPSGCLRDILIMSGCFSLIPAMLHKCSTSHFDLCFSLTKGQRHRWRGLQNWRQCHATALMLKIVNCPNKNVLSGDSGSS